MTRPLSEGLSSPGPPFAMSRRHVTPAAAGREAAQDCRNQMITEFFKPVLSPDRVHKDRTVLSSPDKGNVKDEGAGLSVLRTEGFERNSSSPKEVRRKRCHTKHQISPVRNGCSGRKIMHLSSREIGSDDPSQPRLTQVLEHEASSPPAFRTSSEMASGAPKSPAVPSHFLKVSFGLSKPRDFPGKRKHIAMSVDVDSSGQSEMNEPAFSRSPSKCKTRRCDFVKNIFLKSPHDDVLQLKEPAALSRHDLTLSEEFFNSSNEKEKNNYSTVGLSSSYSAHSPAKNNHISVVDTKENQLQLANSCFSLDKSLPFSQEKSTVLPSPHHLTQTKGTKSPLQVAGLPQVLDVIREQDKRPERHERNKGYSIQPSNSFSNTIHEISENSSDSCRMEISGKLGLSPENGRSVPPSLPVKESFMDSGNKSSQSSGEMEVETNFTHKSKPNRKWQSSSESEDDILESILDDDEEEVVLMPLQKMLSSSLKPQTRALEDSFDSVSQDAVTPLLNLHLSKTPVTSEVSYVNSLDNLLKEEEERKRKKKEGLDEMEKQLQEDVERGDNASNGGDEDNASGADLLEEQRAFMKRFSVVTYAIPDKHPGEDLFNLSAAGRIFTQHDLDLRNFHFIPQNHVEYLLLNSGLRQQLFLVVNGVLSSSYRATLCPVPILKWLFQMMSIHPDHCVSTQILSRLMELTLKNSSINDQQFKPWIPSIADISTVFVNMGIEFQSLFPLQHLQPSFNEHDILSQAQERVSQQWPRGDVASPALPSLLENNLINVIKFLVFCTSVIHDGYTDHELWLLLVLLFKISLEKQLKQHFVVDFQCLLVKLLMSVKDWDTKMPELCLAVSELSSNHHNLLWLVQLVPSLTARGREVKRRLSLVIIAKFLHKRRVEIPDDSDEQMFLLRRFLVCMKPSYLLKKMRKMRKGQEEHKDDKVHAELEHEVYYLVYVLLHLVSEASFLDVVNSSQRQHLLKLCHALDKHVNGDIKGHALMFYRSKVKGLATSICRKWQDVIQTTRLTQGKLHDFWEPDS